jgi:hypothetical protein
MLLLNPFDHSNLDFYAKFKEIVVYYHRQLMSSSAVYDTMTYIQK